MAKRNGQVSIPPPRHGRPLGPDARRLMALEVGQREPFDRPADPMVREARDAALRTLASSVGRRMGRQYRTRIENDQILAVWRES